MIDLKKGYVLISWVGGPAQKLANFQKGTMGPKSGQTCSTHSPDGDTEVSKNKIDLLVPNQRAEVGH